MKSSSLRQQGFGMVEVLIALFLGLVVTAAILNMFLSNAETLRTTAALSRIQEDMRNIFDFLGEDLRQSRSTPCGHFGDVEFLIPNADQRILLGNDGPTAASGNARWFGFRAFEAGATLPDFSGIPLTNLADGLSTHEALLVQGVRGASFQVEGHALVSGQSEFLIPVTPDPGFGAGELLLVCDGERAAVIKVDSVDSSSGQIAIHATQSLDGFEPGSLIARYRSAFYYVDDNDSLIYVVQRTSSAAEFHVLAEEIENFSFVHLRPSDAGYQTTGIINGADDWANVTAVGVSLGLDQQTGDETVNRTMSRVIQLRNR